MRMSLCGACVDLAKKLSNVISAGHEDTSSQKPIRHDRPFRQVRDVDHNSCPMCSLLQSRYTREDEDNPLDDSFSAEMVPCWVRDDAPGVGAISKPHRYVLRTLFVSVRRDRSGLGNLEDGSRVYPPVPLQLFAPRGKYMHHIRVFSISLINAGRSQAAPSHWGLPSGVKNNW